MQSAKFWNTSRVAPAPYPAAGEQTTDGGAGATKQGAEKDEVGSDDEKPKEEDKMSHKKSMATTASRDVKSQMQKIEADKMKNGCQRCCGKIMAFFAQDAIYGSFVGPHPVSFLLFCALFKTKCPCTKRCSRPLVVASVATKLMNFLMLGVITVLAGFFIIPWPKSWLSLESTSLSSFYPCSGGKMIKYKEANGGCTTHAGYFMAYRCFFAYATLMLTNGLLMIRVSNTKDDPYRSKIHHGFWLYKYIYLFVLLCIYFFMVNGERDKEGVFEFTASVIGNVAHLLFSLVEITFVMDLVELWVYDNRTRKGTWANFIYGTVTFLVFIVCVVIYIRIWIEYGLVRVYKDTDHKWPAWPDDNCIEGVKKGPDFSHAYLILSTSGIIGLLFIVQGFGTLFRIGGRFPYSGWLQVGVMILFNLAYLWSALTNSSNVHSRPHCNTAYGLLGRSHLNDSSQVQLGSQDQYLGSAGLFHGIVCLFSLFYFAFVHGPRSHTAPLSIFYAYVLQIVDRVPVYPDEDDAEVGYFQAIEQRKVWDDEQIAVAQSWTLFYSMMILGSLSLMMSMTNFTNPWAADYYNSSNVAYYCKFGTAVIATGIYIIILISKCGSIHKYGSQAQTIRKRSVGEVLEMKFDFDAAEEDLTEEEGDPGQAAQNTTFQFDLPRGEKVELKKEGAKTEIAEEKSPAPAN